jgi:hypothetical protein
MPRPLRTRPVSAAQVRAYAGKAQEFADAAISELAVLESANERPGKTTVKFWSSWEKHAATAPRSSGNSAVYCR